MWIASKYGFFSIVRADSQTKMMLRACSKSHLAVLADAYPEIIDVIRIIESTGTDYPYRIIIDEKDAADLMFELTDFTWSGGLEVEPKKAVVFERDGDLYANPGLEEDAWTDAAAKQLSGTYWQKREVEALEEKNS